MLQACSFSRPMIRSSFAAFSASPRSAATTPSKHFSGSTAAPVRKHAHDPRARPMRDLERARRQPRLIVERVLGREHVLLKARVHLRRVRQHALQQRRGDRDDLHALRRARSALARSISSSVRSMMFLPNTIRSSAPVMPISAMERDGFFDIGRKFVGDGGDTK